MLVKVQACAKGVSVIHHSLPRHTGKGMGMCQKCFSNMPGNVSIPTEIVSTIYGDLPRQAGKGMSMRQKCFGDLPFPTEACKEVYPYPPKLFRKFMVTFRGKPAKVWACAESVSVIYHSPPRHARRRTIPIPTKIVSEIYGDLSRQASKGMGMCRKCFGNLLFHTEACWEVYPHPPKLFRQFILTYQGMPARACACAESVSVIYHSPPRHARRCIHTHQNCFGNLW
jgi:hypothetical protein